jgi:hypothetical protein
MVSTAVGEECGGGVSGAHDRQRGAAGRSDVDAAGVIGGLGTAVGRHSGDRHRADGGSDAQAGPAEHRGGMRREIDAS